MEKASATGSRKAKKPGNFEVIHALDEPQQKIALVDPKAYSDILTAASRKAVLQGQPSGLPAAKTSVGIVNGRAVSALFTIFSVNTGAYSRVLIPGRDRMLFLNCFARCASPSLNHRRTYFRRRLSWTTFSVISNGMDFSPSLYRPGPAKKSAYPTLRPLASTFDHARK